jgi:OOP family OmpA-OmpF porin
MFKTKSLVSIFALASAMLSTSASAQFYAGGSVGSNVSNEPCFFYSNCTKSNTGYKLFTGYDFNKQFAIEASYLQLGKAASSFTDGTIFRNQSLQTSGISLAGVMNHDFTDNFTGFVKLGLASLKETDKVKYSSPSTNFNGSSDWTNTNVMFGAGVKYKVNDKVSLRLEFEQYRDKSNVRRNNAQQISAGVQYGF